MSKQYIEVIVKHDITGKKTPLEIVWGDGRRFEIDRIFSICRTASLKSGGVGDRYTCRVRNKMLYLYDEMDQWFMEVIS